MKKITRHLFLPGSAPIAIISLYFTPKHVFGCANRGLMAVGVAGIALVLACVTATQAISAKKQGDIEQANWWILQQLS